MRLLFLLIFLAGYITGTFGIVLTTILLLFVAAPLSFFKRAAFVQIVSRFFVGVQLQIKEIPISLRERTVLVKDVVISDRGNQTISVQTISASLSKGTQEYWVDVAVLMKKILISIDFEDITLRRSNLHNILDSINEKIGGLLKKPSKSNKKTLQIAHVEINDITIKITINGKKFCPDYRIPLMKIDNIQNLTPKAIVNSIQILVASQLKTLRPEQLLGDLKGMGDAVALHAGNLLAGAMKDPPPNLNQAVQDTGAKIAKLGEKFKTDVGDEVLKQGEDVAAALQSLLPPKGVLPPFAAAAEGLSALPDNMLPQSELLDNVHSQLVSEAENVTQDVSAAVSQVKSAVGGSKVLEETRGLVKTISENHEVAQAASDIKEKSAKLAGKMQSLLAQGGAAGVLPPPPEIFHEASSAINKQLGFSPPNPALFAQRPSSTASSPFSSTVYDKNQEPTSAPMVVKSIDSLPISPEPSDSTPKSTFQTAESKTPTDLLDHLQEGFAAVGSFFDPKPRRK